MKVMSPQQVDPSKDKKSASRHGPAQGATETMHAVDKIDMIVSQID